MKIIFNPIYINENAPLFYIVSFILLSIIVLAFIWVSKELKNDNDK